MKDTFTEERIMTNTATTRTFTPAAQQPTRGNHGVDAGDPSPLD